MESSRLSVFTRVINSFPRQVVDQKQHEIGIFLSNWAQNESIVTEHRYNLLMFYIMNAQEVSPGLIADIVQAFGCSVNHLTLEGMNVLHFAALCRCSLPVFELLVRLGCCPNQVNTVSGWSVLDYLQVRMPEQVGQIGGFLIRNGFDSRRIGTSQAFNEEVKSCVNSQILFTAFWLIRTSEATQNSLKVPKCCVGEVLKYLI